MHLNQFKEALKIVNTLRFRLPNGQLIPPHFHITEVGESTKNLSIVAIPFVKRNTLYFNFGMIRIPATDCLLKNYSLSLSKVKNYLI